MYVEYHTKCQVYKMSELNMFITAVCVLFLKHEGFYWKHKETGRLAQLAHLSKSLQSFLKYFACISLLLIKPELSQRIWGLLR